MQKRGSIARRALASLTPDKPTAACKKKAELCTKQKEIASLTQTTCGAVLLEHLLSTVDTNTGMRGHLLNTATKFLEVRKKQLVKEFKSKLTDLGLELHKECYFAVTDAYVHVHLYV